LQFILRELPMSRMALYAASLATLGFVAGAVVGPRRGAQDDPRPHRVADRFEPIRHARESAPPHESLAEPQRVAPLAAEPRLAEAGVVSPGSTGREDPPPNLSFTALARAIVRKAS
jgi:hypothetical protein